MVGRTAAGRPHGELRDRGVEQFKEGVCVAGGEEEENGWVFCLNK